MSDRGCAAVARADDGRRRGTGGRRRVQPVLPPARSPGSPAADRRGRHRAARRLYRRSTTSTSTPAAAAGACRPTVVIKLNGGLATSMGLDRAKSLLAVKDGLSFLDVIARQVLAARAEHGVPLPLVLMNSFRTRDDSLAALADHPELAVDGLPLDIVQHREPKLLRQRPDARCDGPPTRSWPGARRDTPTSTRRCGPPACSPPCSTAATLRVLLQRRQPRRHRRPAHRRLDGRRRYPVRDGGRARAPPPTARAATSPDAARDGRLMLRETAQTADADLDAFQDIEPPPLLQHQQRVDRPAQRCATCSTRDDGVLDLPLIRNAKTVDPQDPSSPAVDPDRVGDGRGDPGVRRSRARARRPRPVRPGEDHQRPARAALRRLRARRARPPRRRARARRAPPTRSSTSTARTTRCSATSSSASPTVRRRWSTAAASPSAAT